MEKTIYYSDKFKFFQNRRGFSINFLKERETDDEGEIDYGFRIGLSPVAAKEFMYQLISVIEDYEKNYGLINSDPSVALAMPRPTTIGFCIGGDKEKEIEK